MKIREIFENHGDTILIGTCLASLPTCVGCWMIAAWIKINPITNAIIQDPLVLIQIMMAIVLIDIAIFVLWLIYPKNCPKCAIEIDKTIYKCYNCGSTNTREIKDYKIVCRDCGKINLRR